MLKRLLLIFLFALTGCSVPLTPVGPLVLKDTVISSDTTWQGEVLIEGKVHFQKGVSLRILPGADIRFVVRDLDRDGLGDSTLVVEGALLAEGTAENPIRFRSASETPGEADWLEIRVDFSPDVRLRYCEISHSAHTLHAHFTKGFMEDCTIRGNIDGCRLGEASFAIRNCLVERNSGKGINFRNSRVELTGNIIRYNGSGVFLFENNRDIVVEGNNFHDNLENFRLGDFFTGDVQLGLNWWGAADPVRAEASIYDRKVDPGIGTVEIMVAPAWLPGTGPRRSLQIKPAWTYATGAFVDASVVCDNGSLYVGGWDGEVHALDREGNHLWTASVGDVVDAPVALGDDLIFGQNWGREVFALNKHDGRTLWRFLYPASPADDHRQGASARLGSLVLAPGWNGTLYALEASTGQFVWQFDAGLPLRSRPVVVDGRIFITSGSGRLSVLDSEGRLLWQVQGTQPFLSEIAPGPDGLAVLAKDGQLSGYDFAGTLLWQVRLDGPNYYGAPVYSEGAYYVATGSGTLWKVDASTGRVFWSREGFGPIYSTPLVDGTLVVFGDNLGAVHVVDVDSADELGVYRVADAVQSTPLSLGKRLVFGSRAGGVHAVDIEFSR